MGLCAICIVLFHVIEYVLPLLLQYGALRNTHQHDHSQNMFHYMLYHSHNIVLWIRYAALCNTHKHDLLQRSFDRMWPFCPREKEAATNNTESAEAQEQDCTSTRTRARERERERESVCERAGSPRTRVHQRARKRERVCVCAREHGSSRTRVRAIWLLKCP